MRSIVGVVLRRLRDNPAPRLEEDEPLWFARRMLRLSALSVPFAAALFASSCVTPTGGSICGDVRPCVPEGTWLIQYGEGPEGVVLSRNQVEVFPDGTAEVVEELPRENECPPDETGPGELSTSAVLSANGCFLEVFIEKSWCQNDEPNCDNRRIRLSFCEGGTAVLAAGALRACICNLTGSPACDTLDDNFVTSASAARID
jgi:hypothetical protein